MFKKGHNPRGAGRKPNAKVKRNLSDDNTTGRINDKSRASNRNGFIDAFPITKNWDTSARHKQLDPELVDYYINNDLDVTELFDDLKTYIDRQAANREYAAKYNERKRKEQDGEGM